MNANRKTLVESGRGFTLIELLTVCAILAALAYVTWGAYMGADTRAEDELAQVELLRLAAALQRFHDDTGYWPGEGPFRLAGEKCADLAAGGMDSGGLPIAESVSDHAARKQWFASPANFSLLYERPAFCDKHPLRRLATWNAESHRGWNGPYLPLAGRLWLDARQSLPVGASMNLHAAANIPAFGAGPKFPPDNRDPADCIPEGGQGYCFAFRDMGWTRNGYDADRQTLARYARPFFFFRETREANRQAARVVYWGADGRYGGTHPDDPCKPNSATKDGKDDRIVCLANTLTPEP
jgi:prepilin-type N-terminal cleavage/methylation domain-containing protein